MMQGEKPFFQATHHLDLINMTTKYIPKAKDAISIDSNQILATSTKRLVLFLNYT